MGRQPYYILFAGVNGAGKSTLYRTGLWQHGSTVGSLARVNSDEILVANGWDWSSEADQMKAGRLAVKAIRTHLEKRESFNQETTLTGRAILRTIRNAREVGYRIIMYYVCVSNPSVANERIAHRGEIGGHSIDPDVVERRYDASLANLATIMGACDEAYLYDNTVSLELEARFSFGKLAYFNPSEPHLDWIARTMNALGYLEVGFGAG